MRMCGVWGHPNIVQHVLDTQRVTTSSRSIFDCLCSLGPPAAENVRNSSAHGTVQTVISALHTTTPALPGMLSECCQGYKLWAAACTVLACLCPQKSIHSLPQPEMLLPMQQSD
jgi:hypothetical protein